MCNLVNSYTAVFTIIVTVHNWRGACGVILVYLSYSYNFKQFIRSIIFIGKLCFTTFGRFNVTFWHTANSVYLIVHMLLSYDFLHCI